eukprot:gene3681-4585_t
MNFKRASFKLPPGTQPKDFLGNNGDSNINNTSTGSDNNSGNSNTQRKVTFGSRRGLPPTPQQDTTSTPSTTNTTTTTTTTDDISPDLESLDPIPISRPRANRAATMIPTHMINKPIRMGRGGLMIGGRTNRGSSEVDDNTNTNTNNGNNNSNENSDDSDSDDDAPTSTVSWSTIMNKTKSNGGTIGKSTLNGSGNTINNGGTTGQLINLDDNPTTEEPSSRRGTFRKAIVIGTHNKEGGDQDSDEENAKRISSLDLANVSRPKQQYHTIDPASIPQWKKNNEDIVKNMETTPAPTPTTTSQPSSGGFNPFSSILKASPLSKFSSNNNNNSNTNNRMTRADAEYNEYLQKSKNEQFPDIESLNFIYQAGKDHLNRTIVVVVAANLPVRQIDMERVLLYTISVMDPVVEGDYVLIYAHTNMSANNKPSFAWLSKVYTIFNRKYKKNLKGLYIIHPTSWIKFTLRLFKPFLSSKFWRKLTYIDDLTDLFKTFAKDQLYLPQHVMTYRPSGKKLPPIFGAPLEEVINRPDNTGEIPVLFEKGLAYLYRRGLEVEGIFRLSGSNSQIKQLRQGFDSGEEVDLDDVEDVHTVAGLLKLYLRELPKPLFPFDTYSSFIEIAKGNAPKQQKIESLKLLLSFLPPANKALAKHLFKFLTKVTENSSVNKMTSVNLSIVFAPNILKDGENNVLNIVADAQYVNQVVQLIIENSPFIIPPS